MRILKKYIFVYFLYWNMLYATLFLILLHFHQSLFFKESIFSMRWIKSCHFLLDSLQYLFLVLMTVSYTMRETETPLTVAVLLHLSFPIEAQVFFQCLFALAWVSSWHWNRKEHAQSEPRHCGTERCRRHLNWAVSAPPDPAWQFPVEACTAEARVWGVPGRRWRAGKRAVLQAVGSQRLGHEGATEQQQHSELHPKPGMLSWNPFFRALRS